MTAQKIVRTICYFSPEPGPKTIKLLDRVAGRLQENGYLVQTKRICTPNIKIKSLDQAFMDTDLFLSVGSLDIHTAKNQLEDFYRAKNVSFNINLTREDIQAGHLEILFDIIKNRPSKTFNFAYVFQNPASSPYFPSAHYAREGFAIGLQPTDLSAGCPDLSAWLDQLRQAWHEINRLLQHDRAFLGIDASIAPLFAGQSSLIHLINRFGFSFAESVTTDIYVTMTDYLRQYNPKPVGLGGIMFPCLEDFGLAAEYESGNFPVERNIYLALHSGLGLDTYPLGVDEDPAHLLHIFRLLQGLAKKYGKALSARFVSDGQAGVGDCTDFGNPYLKDVTIRPLRNASAKTTRGPYP